MAKVTVYRYKQRWPLPKYLPVWGTLDAIATLDGCIPMFPTERHVDPYLLDQDGFLPDEIAPDVCGSP